MSMYSREMEDVFVGIDIGKSKSAVAFLNVEGRLRKTEPYYYCKSHELFDKVITVADNFRLIVGIDAPLTLPATGNCRECDRKLLKQRISIYPAGAPFFRAMPEIGIDLKNKLTERGFEVVEIYPYASRVRLKIGLGVNKRTLAGRQRIQSDLARFLPDLSDRVTLKADILDAIIGAYTVYLYFHGGGERIVGEGEIVIPS